LAPARWWNSSITHLRAMASAQKRTFWTWTLTTV